MSICSKILYSGLMRGFAFIAKKITKNNMLTLQASLNVRRIMITQIKYDTDQKEEFIYEIDKGKVFNNFGIVFTADYKIVYGVLPYRELLQLDSKLGGLVISYVCRENKKLRGTAFSLQSIFDAHFRHFILETMPRLFLLRDSGLANQVDTLILSEACRTKRHFEAIKLMGFENKKIVYASHNTMFTAKRLFVSSFPGVRTNYTALWVHDRYLELSRSLAYEEDSNYYHKKIYISRNRSKFRRIINEKAIMNELEKLGYIQIYLEDYTLREQILIFYFSEKIIAPHGMSLTNLIFCDESKTSVLSIVPSIRYRPVYKDICYVCGIRYFEYIETDKKNYRQLFIIDADDQFDMKVDIEKFMLSVDKLERNHMFPI